MADIDCIDDDTITLTNSVYSLIYTHTIPTGFTPGTYNLYLSDNNPTDPFANVRQFISIINVAPQIIISITPTPDPIKTYIPFTISGTMQNWQPTYYPGTLNLLYTNIFTSELQTIITTINTDGSFTFGSTEITLPGVTFKLNDNVNYISSNIDFKFFLEFMIPKLYQKDLNFLNRTFKSYL
jgi:hypothetical protein